MIANVVYFIVALSLLVVIHEFGHFWVAKRCGVKILRFSVGFGKPIWRKQGGDGTEFVLAPIPLGGYVKMLDEREGDVAPEDLGRTFNRQSLIKRMAIVLAGPVSNLLFAVVAYWLLFVMGISGIKPIIADVKAGSYAMQAQLMAGDEVVAVNGKKTPTWTSVIQTLLSREDGDTSITIKTNTNTTIIHKLLVPKVKLDQQYMLLDTLGIEPERPKLPAVLSEIVPNSPAKKAGLLKGDKLMAVNGQPLKGWSEWVKLIQRSANKTLNIDVARQGHIVTLSITPEKSENGLGKIGAGVQPLDSLPSKLRAILQYSPVAAIPEALMQTWQISLLTLKSFVGMFTGQVSIKNLGGPISIAQAAGNAGKRGFQSFIRFLAMISITLGVLNLLPIPMLDGGHLLLFLIETIMRKPLSEKVQVNGQQVGLIVLIMIMGIAFFNDLSRVFG